MRSRKLMEECFKNKSEETDTNYSGATEKSKDGQQSSKMWVISLLTEENKGKRTEQIKRL